jgi:Uma2 family endonuclease
MQANINTSEGMLMEWSEVIDNPILKDLPFKIELNQFGKLLMSPASNLHARIQGRLAATLFNKLPQGEVLTECSIQTSCGVKVADIAWLSDAFIHEFSYTTPYPKAPEICVEIVSPSNSKIEINEKIDLYLAKGAYEVWIVYDLDTIDIYSHAKKLDASKIVDL